MKNKKLITENEKRKKKKDSNGKNAIYQVKNIQTDKKQLPQGI